MQHKFELKPSKIYMMVMIFLFMGGELCLIATGFAWWLTMIFAVFYGIVFYYLWKHYVLMGGEKIITSFRHSNNNANNWYLVTSKNVEHLAKLMSSSVITSFFIILHFDVEQMDKHSLMSVLIFKDMLSVSDFRRLFVDVIIGHSD